MFDNFTFSVVMGTHSPTYTQTNTYHINALYRHHPIHSRMIFSLTAYLPIFRPVIMTMLTQLFDFYPLLAYFVQYSHTYKARTNDGMHSCLHASSVSGGAVQ